MVSAIDRKLLRDIVRLRGQVVTIALVVACGIAAYVSTQGAYHALQDSRDAYYERTNFADAFATCKRAPEALLDRLEVLPGIRRAESRIVENVRVPMPGMDRPPTGRVISLPATGTPALNKIYLRSGRMPDPKHADEVALLESFALEHNLVPGDSVDAIINGRQRTFRVVGLVLSPEFVFAVTGAELTPDPKRTPALFVPEPALEAAFDMAGAFNQVTVTFVPGANPEEVLAGLDRLLEPYGGQGAYTRDLQPSHHVLTGELQQLGNMATIVPAVFLAVAAFLLNVVLARLVGQQRPQIAALKALGYTDGNIGLHYLKLVVLVVLLGATVGTAVGAYLGDGLTELYTAYFHFPVLVHRLRIDILSIAILVSLGAAVFGALSTMRHVAQLPPAEAMRPAPPTVYRRLILDRLGKNWVGPVGRMIFREVERRPFRLVLSSLGIAMAVAILVIGRFSYDSINYLMDVHFHIALRDDYTAVFPRPMPEGRALAELRALPGVMQAEGIRAVPVRFQHGSHKRDAVLFGFPRDLTLRQNIDKDANLIPLPRDGLMLTDKLAEILHLEAGQRVEVRVREGQRRTYHVPVVRLADEMFGLQGYMELDRLNELLGDEPVISMGLLRVDAARAPDLNRSLAERPLVAGVLRLDDISENFREQTGEMMLTFTLILAIFAATIAIGVVYNNARVTLSARSRDLGSLRVMGFTRAEVSRILLGELALQVILAVPIGLILGTWASQAIAANIDPENYRIPPIISAQTYSFASLVAIGSAVVSALFVRRRLDRLDLISVLKTSE